MPPSRARGQHGDHALVGVGRRTASGDDVVGDWPVVFLDVVDITHGHGDGRVPEPCLQPPRVHPEACRVRGEGVAERVPASRWKARPTTHAIDAVLERRLPNGLAVCPADDASQAEARFALKETLAVFELLANNNT
jgi:hypothetical protein